MKRISLFTFFIFLGIAGCMAQVSGEKIEKVYVAFKTHLDVGFTDLSSVVTERYVHDFIPKAIEVSERLRADGSGDRYVWTTGSWLIWKYLRTASPEAVKQLEEAIGRGDIVWNSVPYTVESETMTRELFETCLLLSKRLDKKYNKQTIAAKMTDVPGHTRSIIDPMYDAGIRLLHVGINSACPLPSVPTFCRWRSPSGNDLLLVYQKDYGEDEVLPDGKTVVSINFTGDNHGPHSYERVKKIYADLRKRYPQAQLVGASFNDVARELLLIKKDLPVVTSEIGDTWIFGYGGAPIRMAKFRAVSRLYSQWLNEGKIKKDSDVALDFAAELGLIAEHTQGVDVKTHLRQWDKYDMDKFLKGRSEGVFSMAEASWKEIDNYIDSAIAFLPASLQKEAREVVAEVDKVKLEDNSKMKPMARKRWEQPIAGGMTLTGLSYQMFDGDDYDDFQNRYLRARYGWALDDLGKRGLKESHAVSVTLYAQTMAQSVRKEKKGTRIITELRFPENEKVDKRVYPERIQVNCFTTKNGKRSEVALTIYGKPAVRLPESYWLSFTVPGIELVIAEKMGERVNLMDVVEKGNRQMHGIDRYVDLITSGETIRISSKEAFLLNVGEAQGLNYSTNYPDKRKGVHFNLNNNLWGTNFSMWNEGSLTYHFVIETLSRK
jgi:hypothetical protein